MPNILHLVYWFKRRFKKNKKIPLFGPFVAAGPLVTLGTTFEQT